MSAIEVSGGAAGLSVGLDELEESARRLRSLALDLGEVAASIGLAATDPRLALAGLLAPVEYLAAEGALLGCIGPHGAAGAAADVTATALATTTAVRTYRGAEEAVESLADGIATQAGAWVGRTIAPVALGVGLAVAPVVPLVLAVPGARDAVVGVGLGLGEGIDQIVLDHPWIVPAAADGLDGLLLGLGQGLPVLGLWLAWRSGRAGTVYPPRTQAEALGVVLAATRGAVLDESGRHATVRAREPRVGVRPRGVADLVAGDGPTSGRSRVRVTGISQPDGGWAWVVDVPGTQTFDPTAGANPWDMTSNVLLVAGRQTATMTAVVSALEDSRRRVGDTGPPRVMLTGHSQGGLVAAALAADPRLRERLGVTHVVTSGAPIASLDVPPEVSVLSIEHTEDPVPALEGADNPDRSSWVTVERSLADELGEDGRATQAHDNGRYAETAQLVDASDDPSITAWRADAVPYLGDGPGATVTTDYDVARQ